MRMDTIEASRTFLFSKGVYAAFDSRFLSQVAEAHTEKARSRLPDQAAPPNIFFSLLLGTTLSSPLIVAAGYNGVVCVCMHAGGRLVSARKPKRGVFFPCTRWHAGIVSQVVVRFRQDDRTGS